MSKRDKKGRFSASKPKIFWFSVVLVVIIGVSGAIFSPTQAAKPETIGEAWSVLKTSLKSAFGQTPEDKFADVDLEGILEPVKNITGEDIVERLQTKLAYKLSNQCEVKGIPDNKKNGVIILDSNDQMSIGRWMYQRETIIDVMKRYKGVDISWDESTTFAMNEDKALELTKYLIFEKDELHRWTNCANKLNLWSEVEYINEIAQELS